MSNIADVAPGDLVKRSDTDDGEQFVVICMNDYGRIEAASTEDRGRTVSRVESGWELVQKVPTLSSREEEYYKLPSVIDMYMEE